MKAITYNQFGPPDVLKPEDIAKPLPKANEVLIKVRATSINSWDWDMLRGQPKVFRFLYGFVKPRYSILGADVAGVVEAVGSKVTRFKPGDEVMGDLCECNWGGLAEYTCARENALALKPAQISFEEGASLTQAGLLALQGLTHKRPLQPGQKVLINGAGGGVGTFAIQIAKLHGAEVTGVDSSVKLDTIRALGADHVMDYSREDFTKNGRQYDLILDMVAHRSIADYKRALRLDGIYSMIGGTPSAIFKVISLGGLLSAAGNKKISIMPYKPNQELDKLASMAASGQIKPVIDSTFPLNQTADAFRYFGENRFCGKIVITI